MSSESYPSWAKMPENYNFSTRNVDWSAYHPYFRLRTDAVWEKSKLFQWFRAFYKKHLYFNHDEKQYYYVAMMDQADMIDPTTFEMNSTPYMGFSESGATRDFQMATLRRNSEKIDSQAFALNSNTDEMCSYKFDKWSECDVANNRDRGAIARNFQTYPCYEHFYEANYACSDELIQFLSEMHYYRLTNMTSHKRFANAELLTFPKLSDSIDANSRTKLSY